MQDVVRLAVNMNPETASALREVMKQNAINATEAIRRAIVVAHFIENEVRSGREVIIRNPTTGAQRELLLMLGVEP